MVTDKGILPDSTFHRVLLVVGAFSRQLFFCATLGFFIDLFVDRCFGVFSEINLLKLNVLNELVNGCGVSSDLC